MRFRKRPVVVEAEQFLPERKPWPAGVYGVRNGGSRDDDAPHYWQIDTLEGAHVASPGDWIITGIKGERYPCKPDIFAATYEAVDDGARDNNRCAVCGWPLAMTAEQGCVRANCSQRPRPDRLYDHERHVREVEEAARG